MPILPNGKKVNVEKSVYSLDHSQWGLEGFLKTSQVDNYNPEEQNFWQEKNIGTFDGLMQNEDPVFQENKEQNSPVLNDEEKQEFVKIPEKKPDGKRHSDVENYILEKLQSFGYPLRRLEDFSEEFVEETITVGNNNSMPREVIVVLPDRYYGSRDRISEDDLQKIISELSSMFKLHLLEGKRKDKKITLKFTSSRNDVSKGSESEAQPQTDELDEIFGDKTKNMKKKENKKESMFVTASHDDIITELSKIIKI